MRTSFKVIATVIGLGIAAVASAQMIYGNRFPYWTVDGALTVGSSGSTTLNHLTASLPVVTDANKALVSATVTGTGTTVVMSASPTFTGTVTVPIINVTTSASPLSGDACTAGRIVWDASYIYVCTASGAWKRAALTGGY